MKKVLMTIVVGLVSMLLVGCGPERLNLQPNMQEVARMSKGDAVTYLNNLRPNNCTFSEDYITMTQFQPSVSKQYGQVNFGASKDGSSYRVCLGVSDREGAFYTCTLHGTNLNETKSIINALDKLGVIVQ